MKACFTLFISLSLILHTFAQTKTIHVFVALCDNEHQGIVPVPAALGNGKDPNKNLYWGAAYGVKSFLKNKSPEWQLLATLKSDNPFVLERLLFKHSSKNVYLLADAYDGERIKDCTQDFLRAANWQNPQSVHYNSQLLPFGGQANLVAYVGHDGLMEFRSDLNYNVVSKPKDVIVLACASQMYFEDDIKRANANPILWTTHLMAPEAYTLVAAINGWILNENTAQIKERAAQAYNKYQNCGLKGARSLFATGI